MCFFYAPPFSYVEKAPFFSKSSFFKSSLVCARAEHEREKCIILYDPVDILIQNHFQAPSSDAHFWCASFVDILDQVRQSGCRVMSIWRLEYFFDKCGHLDVLADSPESHNLLSGLCPPRSSPSFQYFAAALVREEPVLLNSYLDLELSSLLLGSEIDSAWLASMNSTKNMALDLMEEFRVLSASLEASHDDLEAFFLKSQQQAIFLEDYAKLLKSSYSLITRQTL